MTFHRDLPLPLDGIGGWANDELIHHFTNFAHLVFHTFGDRVKKWVTFNEPNIICMLGFVFKVRVYKFGYICKFPR